jgi:hypothetical protein
MTITVRGKAVQVTDTDGITTSAPPFKLLEAIIGSVSVKKTVTFGAVDGSRLPITLSQLQQDLDTARQQVADEAAWREELKETLKQVS